MEKITLKLYEILNLLDEIYGFQNPNTKEVLMKGLLKQNLTIETKYWINSLGRSLSSETESVKFINEELFKKYGENQEEGNSVIFPSIRVEDGIDEEGNPKYKIEPNPKFIEYQKEYSKILEQEKEISYKPFKLSELASITTEENYPIFQKLIVAE